MDSRSRDWDNRADTADPATPVNAPNPTLLEARELAYLRQDEPVFAPISFTLGKGEVALIEGDNGSGKTTLMRVLNGTLHAGAGELLLYGQPLRRESAAGEIAFLGHQLGLKLDLSARENLRFTEGLYGRRRGITPDSALAGVGLAGYEFEPVRRLSAGQKKRVALARLLLVPAALWLLDEPYANLDREGIALVNRLIERHAYEGGSVMVTSHGAVTFLNGQARRIALAA